MPGSWGSFSLFSIHNLYLTYLNCGKNQSARSYVALFVLGVLGTLCKTYKIWQKCMSVLCINLVCNAVELPLLHWPWQLGTEKNFTSKAAIQSLHKLMRLQKERASMAEVSRFSITPPQNCREEQTKQQEFYFRRLSFWQSGYVTYPKRKGSSVSKSQFARKGTQ